MLSTTATVKSSRLRSLDALRGFDMFWIVSGEGIFHGIASVIKTKHNLVQSTADWQIAVNDSLSLTEKVFIGISNQLHHTVWNGFTFYDLIFPLFIFIAGISMPFSFGSQLEKEGAKITLVKKQVYRQLVRRTILLIILGMVVNGVLQLKGYADTRFASVLGRIALSCFFAAIIFLNCSLRAQLIWFAGILLGYWAVMMWIPVPGFGAGILTPEGNFSAYTDRLLLPGKLHRTVYDPEGLLSTIPAIASAMLGLFTGQFLRNTQHHLTPTGKAAVLFAAAVVLVLTGWLWGIAFPLNKNMWTSSFVLYAGGWSMLLFALFYYVIDVLQLKKWSAPFVWMGCNSILVYMAAHGLVHFEYTARFVFGGIIRFFPVLWEDALVWTAVAMVQFALLFLLYRNKWFLKL